MLKKSFLMNQCPIFSLEIVIVDMTHHIGKKISFVWWTTVVSLQIYDNYPQNGAGVWHFAFIFKSNHIICYYNRMFEQKKSYQAAT